MRKKAFTLVELIVVITILAILWTIAFISLQWYAANARDSRRISDIWNIKKSLELFTLQTEKYPLPDNGETVTYSWEIVWTQWTLWDNVVKQLSRNIKKKPLDPITNEEYIYSTTENRWEYEVLAIYEWWIANNTILNQTHAADTWYVKVDGTYNQLYTSTDSFIIPTPSLITSEELPLVLDGTNIKSQVVTGQLNRPSRTNTAVQTWWLDIVLSVYTGSLKKTSTDQEKIDAMAAIQSAYTWSILSIVWSYQNLLSQTSTWELVSFVDVVVLNNNTSWQNVSASQWWNESPSLDWWRVLDSNCDIDDIVIWTQTWAGCNSTLWDWFEWWKQDNGSDWTVWSCLDYSWNNNATCTIDDVSMASSTKANTWFTGINSNLDTEVDNIWWKLYTWTNSTSACPIGRHVPSDGDWEILETTLNGSNCRNTSDGWKCDGLWWKLHNTKDASNNIVQALKVPLAGHRTAWGTLSTHRGLIGSLWTSTPTGGNAYYRRVHWNNSTINRFSYSQTMAFSISCLQD